DEDLYKAVIKSDASDKRYVPVGRLSVIVVSIVSLFLAWTKNATLLKLVSFACAVFGASFAPIIVLTLYWRKTTAVYALSGMMVGAITVIIWGNTELINTLYEIVPGFVLNTIVTVIVSLLTYKPNKEIDREFNETINILKQEK